VSTYTCRWCGLACDPADLSSCPHCGAPIDVREEVSDSGWEEQPPIKDMARLQCGQSSVQIEGAYVPVADFNLAAGDGVYYAHHQILWTDPTVKMSVMPMKGAWRRMFAGMPLIMMQAHGPGHIAFSRDAPGEMVAVPLQPGAAVDVREHIFVVANHAVEYDWFQTNVWYTCRTGNDNNDTETTFPIGQFMDRFVARDRPGLLLLHAAGNAFVRTLAPGQRILIKPTALLYKDPSVQMRLHFEQPAFSSWRPFGRWGNSYICLELIGPGKVAVHSAYDPLELPGYIVQNSPATVSRW
jgi:uncharacterized protein (AIM24 family)